MKSLKSFMLSVQAHQLVSKFIYLVNKDLSDLGWLESIFLSSVLITSMEETTNRTWCQWLWQKKSQIIGTTIGIVGLGVSLYALSLGVQRSMFLNGFNSSVAQGYPKYMNQKDILPYASNVTRRILPPPPNLQTVRLLLDLHLTTEETYLILALLASFE
jgi:hypothetical protein